MTQRRVWIICGAVAGAAALALSSTLGLHRSAVTAGVPVVASIDGAGGVAARVEATYVAAIDSVSPSVVQIQTPVGLGSGVVFDHDGDIVTNNHVVDSFTRFVVTDSSERRYQATLIGTCPQFDLAVIHAGHAQALRPALLGDSARLRVGDLVLAVGNPLGLQSSVTNGIISALGRSVNEQQGVVLADLIQTSAAINPGNSGGALVDLEGRVVGVPTLAAVNPESMQQANGIGFAIPSNTVRQVALRLLSDLPGGPGS